MHLISIINTLIDIYITFDILHVCDSIVFELLLPYLFIMYRNCSHPVSLFTPGLEPGTAIVSEKVVNGAFEPEYKLVSTLITLVYTCLFCLYVIPLESIPTSTD